jgi:uncharacterized SAM-binding protein YcdF (DUF218 family)
MGGWYFLKKNKKAGITNCVLAFIIWIFSTAFFSNILFQGLETDSYHAKIPEGDVIVLLTGGSTVEGHTRLFAVAKLQRTLDIPVIISGEKIGTESCRTPKSNEHYLIEIGVPESRIIVESKSRNTIENAKQVSKIMKKYGLNEPILVTSPYHLKRAILAFDKIGIKVLPHAAGRMHKELKCHNISDFLPKTFIYTSAAIKEYFGLIVYQVAY